MKIGFDEEITISVKIQVVIRAIIFLGNYLSSLSIYFLKILQIPDLGLSIS